MEYWVIIKTETSNASCVKASEWADYMVSRDREKGKVRQKNRGEEVISVADRVKRQIRYCINAQVDCDLEYIY